jgi:hypothetical protein
MKPPYLILSLALLSCTEKKEIPTFRIADAKTETTPASPESKEPRPLRWVAPETWEEEKPGQFQVALYRIAPGITAAVSRFPGDAGGTAANVNRWRQQVGLVPSPDTGGEVIALAESDAQARWFELKGAERSILAAIIPVDGETWFFKLDSLTIALETARPGFMDFLKSVEIGSTAEQMGGETVAHEVRIDIRFDPGAGGVLFDELAYARGGELFAPDREENLGAGFFGNEFGAFALEVGADCFAGWLAEGYEAGLFALPGDADE